MFCPLGQPDRVLDVSLYVAGSCRGHVVAEHCRADSEAVFGANFGTDFQGLQPLYLYFGWTGWKGKSLTGLV